MTGSHRADKNLAHLASKRIRIGCVDRGDAREQTDRIAVEEPLEIRLDCDTGAKREEIPLSITMRTPGKDRELAAGFLFTEGLILAPEDIQTLAPASENPRCNTFRATLRPGLRVDPQSLQRHFYTTSSCGVCGKASLEALRLTGFGRPARGSPPVSPDVIRDLPGKMEAAQGVFSKTGGLHAAALFDASGMLLCLYEDVGRHNAVDKLVGSQLLAGKLPLHDRILLVSGRTSFEILQKALAAQIPVVAAVSAPSSLAVDLARRFGMTLLGFVRGKRFNVYADAGRLTGV